MSAQPFHVNCPYTGQAVCRCPLGTPASVAQQAREYSRNAALQYQIWQQQSQLFAQPQQPPVDIAVPRMHRQTVPDLGPLPPPGPMDRETALKAVQQARLYATAAIERAARFAAAGGVHYQPPPGFEMQAGFQKRDTRELEANVRAIERARAERRARAEQASSSQQQQQQLEDDRQAAYAREAERTQQHHRQQQLQHEQQQANEYAGGWAVGAGSKRHKAHNHVQYPAVSSPKVKSRPTKGQQPKAAAAEEAWAEAPDKGLRLRMKDIRHGLRKRWLQLFWPDDGRWWPGQVLDVRVKERRISLLYKTGEEEADLDIADLVKKGEVAWLNAEEMAAAAEAASLPAAHSEPEGLDGMGLHEYRSAQAGSAGMQPPPHAQRAPQLAYADAPAMGGGGLQVFDDPFERMMNGSRQLPLMDHYI